MVYFRSSQKRGYIAVLFMVYLQVNTLTWLYSCGVYGVLQVITQTWLYRCVVHGVLAGQHTDVAV